MNLQRFLAASIVVGFLLVSISMAAFAQDVVIQISGNRAELTIPSISQGTAAIVTISEGGGFPIKSLEIGAAERIEQAELIIEVLDGKPSGLADVNGTVFEYLSITTNIEPGDLMYVKLNFGIPKDWMTNNDVEATTVGILGIMEGEWSIISATEEVEDSGDEVLFSAQLPHLAFNDYAISGRLPSITTTTTQVTTKVTTITTSLATVTTTATPVVTSTVTTVVQGEGVTAYLAIGVAVIAIIILVMVFRSSRKTRP